MLDGCAPPPPPPRIEKNEINRQPVPFAHTLGVWRFDVLLDDDFPPVTAQPSAEESLNFADFLQIVEIDVGRQSGDSLGADAAVRTLPPGPESDTGRAAESTAESGTSESVESAAESAGSAGRQTPLLFQGAQLSRQHPMSSSIFALPHTNKASSHTAHCK